MPRSKECRPVGDGFETARAVPISRKFCAADRVKFAAAPGPLRAAQPERVGVDENHEVRPDADHVDLQVVAQAVVRERELGDVVDTGTWVGVDGRHAPGRHVEVLGGELNDVVGDSDDAVLRAAGEPADVRPRAEVAVDDGVARRVAVAGDEEVLAGTVVDDREVARAGRVARLRTTSVPAGDDQPWVELVAGRVEHLVVGRRHRDVDEVAAELLHAERDVGDRLPVHELAGAAHREPVGRAVDLAGADGCEELVVGLRGLRGAGRQAELEGVVHRDAADLADLDEADEEHLTGDDALPGGDD